MSKRADVPFEECKSAEIMAKLVDKLTVTGGARKHINWLRSIWPQQRASPEARNQSDMEVINQIVEAHPPLYEYFRQVVEVACKETESYRFPRNPQVEEYIKRRQAQEGYHEGAASERAPDDDQTEQTDE